MAYPADTNWRWDPSAGNNANGGGFAASVSGGVRITSPVAFTDIVISHTDNTKATSSLRPFVATDAGNVLNVTAGTGFTVQRPIILSVDGSNIATFDRALGTIDSTGGTGNLGGSLQVFTDALLELSIAGNVHDVWATATMTLTEALSIAADGTAASPIRIRGCTNLGALNPTGANRPTIAAGANAIFGATPDYWVLTDLIITSTDANGCRLATNGRVRNCSIRNTSSTTSRDGIYGGSGCQIIDCEVQSDYGQGLVLLGANTVYLTYVHDCSLGASGSREGLNLGAASAGYSITECTIDTCLTGANLQSAYALQCSRNTVYNCTTGILATTSYAGCYMNNIIRDCTTAVAWDSPGVAQNYWDFNDFYNNGTDRSNVTAGTNDFDTDPSHTNAAGGDFSRTVTTADGKQMGLGVG